MNKILKNLLADHGYNLVAWPKADIKPLTLLSDEGDHVASLENSITGLFEIDETAPPQISRGGDVSPLVGSSAVSYDADSGLSVLDWLLEKMKMGKLKASLNLDNSKTVTISYEKITEDKVGLLELDTFISGSAPSQKKFNTYKKRLENNELFVINSVLKSNCFTVTIENNDGGEVDLEATIKGIVEANANISRNKKNSFTIKNENETPLAFAFKAQHIKYNKSDWWSFFSREKAGFTINDQPALILKDESEYATTELDVKEAAIDL